MADRYLIETSGVDGYLLEDGTGVLLLEAAASINVFDIDLLRMAPMLPPWKKDN